MRPGRGIVADSRAFGTTGMFGDDYAFGVMGMFGDSCAFGATGMFEDEKIVRSDALKPITY